MTLDSCPSLPCTTGGNLSQGLSYRTITMRFAFLHSTRHRGPRKERSYRIVRPRSESLFSRLRAAHVSRTGASILLVSLSLLGMHGPHQEHEYQKKSFPSPDVPDIFVWIPKPLNSEITHPIAQFHGLMVRCRGPSQTANHQGTGERGVGTWRRRFRKGL